MILKKLWIIPLILIVIACDDPEDGGVETLPNIETEVTPEPQELVDEWNTLWNSDNIVGLQEIFSDEAILIAGSMMASRPEEVDQWISDNVPIVTDLKSQFLNAGGSGDIVYYSGIYEHGFKNDTSVSTGYLALIWQKQQDDSWKVMVADITAK